MSYEVLSQAGLFQLYISKQIITICIQKVFVHMIKMNQCAFNHWASQHKILSVIMSFLQILIYFYHANNCFCGVWLTGLCPVSTNLRSIVAIVLESFIKFYTGWFKVIIFNKFQIFTLKNIVNNKFRFFFFKLFYKRKILV